MAAFQVDWRWRSMERLNLDEGCVHAIQFDLYAVFTSEQHAAAGAAFTTHHDPRLNADGRTMIPDNVEQHGADRDPFANRDIDQRTAGLMHGRGEQHTLLFEWKGGKRGRL
jgi:hypothetical protein